MCNRRKALELNLLRSDSLRGNFVDMTLFILAGFFGLVGMAFLTYGLRMTNIPVVAAGVMLMILPYFISSVLTMLVVCSALTALPFFWRES